MKSPETYGSTRRDLPKTKTGAGTGTSRVRNG